MDSLSYLNIPDSLKNELLTVAQSGFWDGFAIATACIIAMSMLLVVLHLINRAAGH